MFIDMNAYFASVEQQLQPALRHRPVAVVPMVTDSTCCIAVSYEAKAYGIKTGTQVGEAKRLCPGLYIVQARPGMYVQFHHDIVAAVESCLHVDEVYSIDEMCCGLLGAERQCERALELARQVKEVVRRRVGECLRCSIGLAPNRFLAKVATKMEKPDGLVVITPQDLPDKLFVLELDDLPGIGSRMRRRLHRDGIQSVRQLCELSEKELVNIWQSVLGRIWWHQLRGHDLPEIPTHRRTVGHSHVLPPKLRSEHGARGVLVRLIHKAAARLRNMNYWARQLAVRVSFTQRGSWKARAKLGLCQDTLTMVETFSRLWQEYPPGGQPLRVSITLYDLVKDGSAPLPLLPAEQNRVQLARAIDQLNAKYGAHTVYLAGMHYTRDSAPMRISFTNIPDMDLAV